jgi:bacillithiol synthase
VTLLEAYRSGALRDFHRLDSDDFQTALETPHAADRAALSAAVTAYLRAMGAPQTAFENAKLLAHPDSRVVMTGQQAGLLGGPMYAVSKAVTAILLARAHTSEGRPVVPMFWVASQDHDADEVRSATLLDFSETLHRLSLPLPQGKAIGRIKLEEAWLTQTLEVLGAFDAPPEFKAPVLESVTRCFQSSSTYAEWFARLTLELLGPHGLIVIDPLHPAIAPLFAPHIQRELEQPLSSSRAIEQAALKLEALGFHAQLRRTASATNLFLEDESLERRLLKLSGERFDAATRAKLETVLASDPSRLTPAAGLRPIISDATFPVAINVLGPGELAYHLELGGVYALHGIAQPLIRERMSVTILEPPIKRMLAKYNLSADEFVKGGRVALEGKLLEQSSASQTFKTALRDLEQTIHTLRGEITPFEAGLGKALTRSEGSFKFNLERLRHKLGAAFLKAQDITGSQLERLETHLLPNGAPQERVNGFLEFQMKFGNVPLERIMGLAPSGTHWLEI